MKYNTMFDVAFTMEHNEEDPYDVDPYMILEAMQDRINYLRANPQELTSDVFGLCDTYETGD